MHPRGCALSNLSGAQVDTLEGVVDEQRRMLAQQGSAFMEQTKSFLLLQVPTHSPRNAQIISKVKVFLFPKSRSVNSGALMSFSVLIRPESVIMWGSAGTCAATGGGGRGSLCSPSGRGDCERSPCCAIAAIQSSADHPGHCLQVRIYPNRTAYCGDILSGST